jgi:hypothetical protein
MDIPISLIAALETRRKLRVELARQHRVNKSTGRLYNPRPPALPLPASPAGSMPA